MRTIIKSKFSHKMGYWINIEQDGDEFIIVNTKRKQNQIDRDGIPEDIGYLNSLEMAEDFLDEL